MEEININEINGRNIIATLINGNNQISITDFDFIANPHLSTFNNRIVVKIILGNTNGLSGSIQACEIFFDVINRNLFVQLLN